MKKLQKGKSMNLLFPTPKGDITIRMATPEDAALLLKLRLEALTMQPEAFAADIDKTVAGGEKEWASLITDYASNLSGVVCVATSGTELIGMGGITRGHWPKTMHFGTLWGVYVKPDWRGFHIAGELVNAISLWATDNGLTVIYLGVTVSDQSAIRCYSRCGFKGYGIEPKAIFYDRNYYDQVLMAKLL
jgi:RimJ/RimL family protein N-acetyltransferase